MNSLTLKFGVGYSGVATGTAASSSLKASISGVARVSYTGASKMVYVGTTVVAVGGTTTLDLTSGLTSPLNESITGSLDFATVAGVMIEHDVDSLSTSGITVMGGGSNDFQGPWAAGDKPTLLPGAWIAFGIDATKTGWTVNGTNKNIALVNLDVVALHTATVNVFVLGTV